MTDEHEHTEQEQALYDHMHAGEWEQIEQLRADAYAAPPPEAKDGEQMITPAEQFDEDHANAYTHYQADHEAPEKAREAATKAQVQDENATAAKAQEEMA